MNNRIKLSNGVSIPVVMVGTNGMDYLILKSVVTAAISRGFFAFDTAPNYISERYLGRVIKELMSEYGYVREDFFVQTKLDWKDQINNNVEGAFKLSLERLGLEYVDSYLMHWPYPDYYIKNWRQMEEFYISGEAKSIGVCNFRERHWSSFFSSDIKVIPHISQIEIHPLRTCTTLLEFCKSRGIVTQAYSPICKMIPQIRDNEVLAGLASKYTCSIPQQILKWHIQRECVPISKSTNPLRIISNLDCISLEISEQDMININTLNQDYKFMIESWGCPGF